MVLSPLEYIIINNLTIIIPRIMLMESTITINMVPHHVANVKGRGTVITDPHSLTPNNTLTLAATHLTHTMPLRPFVPLPRPEYLEYLGPQLYRACEQGLTKMVTYSRIISHSYLLRHQALLPLQGVRRPRLRLSQQLLKRHRTLLRHQSEAWEAVMAVVVVVAVVTPASPTASAFPVSVRSLPDPAATVQVGRTAPQRIEKFLVHSESRSKPSVASYIHLLSSSVLIWFGSIRLNNMFSFWEGFGVCSVSVRFVCVSP